MSSRTSGSSQGRENRLAESTSPYLLLHRHNPVDWYPWGPEALEKARAEEKPIFLSVGYSTCYWCHVMERESFSDETIASYLNEHFVSVKVDREERPDLDEIYMVATQLMTQHGGWPNSVFLTPELRPFYAGTYFPPEDRHGRPGFPTLLQGIVQAWRERRPELREQARRVAAAMKDYLAGSREGGDRGPRPEGVEAAYQGMRRQFDPEWGGFGGAPKFPSPANLFLLLEIADRPPAREMLETTLDRMARGGLYDQLAGGFHRYATDREWKIPHFEKMLYDNGLLLEAYSLAHERWPTPQRERVIRETAAFLAREMTSEDGALWSAIDAETDGHEGAYYVWTRAEIEEALGEEDAAFLAPFYGFQGAPFFEGSHYVLHLPRTMEEQAAARKIAPQELWKDIGPLRDRLLEVRNRRERPLTDDKVLADWNGLAIAGLATAGRVLEDPGLVEQAVRAARFVLAHHRGDGSLRHTWRAGEAAIDAFLGDYAYLVHGLLSLHEATGAAYWLEEAEALTDEMIERLETPEGGFFAAASAPDLLFQSRDVYDDALPNPNAVAVLNLIDLSERTGEPRWRDRALAALVALGPAADAQPMAARTLILAGMRYRRTPGEGDAGDTPRSVEATDPDSLAARVVEARLRVEEPAEGGWRPFSVELEIEEGWHLNANPASEETLVPTTLGAEGGELRDVRYPPGEILDPEAASSISVYRGTVTIEGEWRAPEGGGVILFYQPCDDRRCLDPVRRVLRPR